MKVDVERFDTEDTSGELNYPIVVKAVADALKSLNSAEVFVNIVRVGVGPISQSDVGLAQACGACRVGFNNRGLPSAISLVATHANIKICIHQVIYQFLEEMGNLIVEKAPGTL